MRASLKAPNFWVAVLSCMAMMGIAFVFAGRVLNRPSLYAIGMWLCVPLIVGGVLLCVVVIPILMIANRKHRRGQ
jgi:hypothetical protein